MEPIKMLLQQVQVVTLRVFLSNLPATRMANCGFSCLSIDLSTCRIVSLIARLYMEIVRLQKLFLKDIAEGFHTHTDHIINNTAVVVLVEELGDKIGMYWRLIHLI